MAEVIVERTIDTRNEAVIKLLNEGQVETDALKVDASALGGALNEITFTSLPSDFTVGEEVQQDQGGGVVAKGIVVSSAAANDKATIRQSFYSPAFATGTDDVVGQDSSVTGTDPTAIDNDLEISIVSMWWLSSGPAIRMLWDADVNASIIYISRSGMWGQNGGFKLKIPDNLTNPTGNILFTTLGLYAADDYYSIILKIRKEKGFAYEKDNY